MSIFSIRSAADVLRLGLGELLLDVAAEQHDLPVAREVVVQG